MLGLVHLVGAGLLAAGLTGCTVLDLLLGVPPFDPNDPGFSFPPLPTAAATFTSGRAEIEFTTAAGTQTLVLDRLTGASSTDVEYGTHVAWTDGAGSYLTLYSFPDIVLPGSAYLTMDRIVGVQHWVLLDGSRCVSTLDPTSTAAPSSTGFGASPAPGPGISGTATCRGLRWADFFSSSPISGLPQPIPDELAFDAEVTFEAH